MILEKLPGVSELSDTDKWQFIDELRTDLLPPPSSTPSPETGAMLEARLAEYHHNPAAAALWAEVKKRLQAARKGTTVRDEKRWLGPWLNYLAE